MEMLRAEPWRYYPLTLQFLSSRHAALRGRCPPPPPHMRVLVAPLEVGCYEFNHLAAPLPPSLLRLRPHVQVV
jgi:hypothetical protein